MTSPLEYEALRKLETSLPEIKELNDNIREETWTNFSKPEIQMPQNRHDMKGFATGSSHHTLCFSVRASLATGSWDNFHDLGLATTRGMSKTWGKTFLKREG